MDRWGVLFFFFFGWEVWVERGGVRMCLSACGWVELCFGGEGLGWNKSEQLTIVIFNKRTINNFINF